MDLAARHIPKVYLQLVPYSLQSYAKDIKSIAGLRAHDSFEDTPRGTSAPQRPRQQLVRIPAYSSCAGRFEVVSPVDATTGGYLR